MRVIAYVPETKMAEQVTSFIDTELPEKDFSVEYAINQDDLKSLIKTSDHDAVLVFSDDEQGRPYAALEAISKKHLKGPIVTLYKDSSPKALLNALSRGSIVAFEFNKAALSGGALAKMLQNARIGYKGQNERTSFGVIEFDFSASAVFVHDEEVKFTQSEYKLLEYLALHEGKPCSKEKIFNSIYLHDEDVDLKIIDVFISKIRKKLNDLDAGLGEMIKTDWGNGYIFTSNPHDVSKRYVCQFGSLEIDLAEQQVRIKGQVVDLTINEFMVLKTFALSYPDNVSRDKLIVEVSKFGRDATSDTIDRIIYAIGRNLTLYGDEFDKFILPVNGGDEFIMNVSKLDEKASKKVKHDVVALGNIKLNRTLRNVSIRTSQFDVTDHEMKILEALIEAFPARITGQELTTKVYGSEGKIFNLNNHLGKLRTKLTEANGGEDLIASRRGMGYTLDIKSDRIMAKFEDQLDVVKLGPWIIDKTRQTISYSIDDGKNSIFINLNKSQLSVFQAIITSYPNAISRDDLLTAVYGENTEGKESALNSLYAQMKGVLKSELGDYSGGFRKIVNGEDVFRFDLDIDDVPQDIIDVCEVKEVGPWAINQTLNMFMFDGDPIDVNDSEYAIISTLIDAYPKPITTADLANKHFDGKQPSLNTCLTLLRKKISEKHSITEPFIQNKRGVGYVIGANKDELAEEQISSMRIIQIGDVSVNMDLGQLAYNDKTIELNAVELFTFGVLSKATKPTTAAELSYLSQYAGKHREPISMYQAIRSLEDKMAEAGFDGQLIDKRRHAGFFLASKHDVIIANSDIQHIGGIKINKTLFEITVAGQSVSLTPSEFKFIETLAQNPRIPLSLEDLSKLSDEDGNPFAEGTLNISKNNIRKKLLAAGVEDGDAAIISNIARVGYFLTAMKNNLDQSRVNGKRETAFTGQQTISVGSLSINTITDRVEYEGTHLEGVSGKPLDALVLMTQRHGDFITNEELATHFFGEPANDIERAKNIGNVERGIGSLRHMIDMSVPQLSQSIIMKVGDKGYGLTLSLEEREAFLEKAGLKKKKTVFASPHAPVNGNGKAVKEMNGASKQPPPQTIGGRRSMADQLRDFKLR